MDKLKAIFEGKNVRLSYVIDNSYIVDRTPQYRPICYIEGVKVFDGKEKLEVISRSDFHKLLHYACEQGKADKRFNAYGRYDITAEFKL